MRRAGALCEVRATQELDIDRLRRHACTRVQLQHDGARASVRGALGLLAVNMRLWSPHSLMYLGH